MVPFGSKVAIANANVQVEWNLTDAFLLKALDEYPVASDYLKNYHRALATLQRCTQENAQFAELTKVIKTTDTHEANTLEGMAEINTISIKCERK